jgi:hypothetical protein
LVIMAALASGFVAADLYGLTAGFAADDPAAITVRVIGALIAIGLVIAAAGPLNRLIRAIVQSLPAQNARPCFGLCMTLILCGTVCILASTAAALIATRYGPVAYTAASSGSFTRSFGHVAIGEQTPLLVYLVSGLTFVAGAALCAIGIWGSMGNSSTRQ